MLNIQEIYEQYFTIVYRYLLSLSHNTHIAEELTQETFFKALKKVDDFRGDCDLRVWLCQISKNTYYDYLKKNKKYAPESQEETEDTFVPDLVNVRLMASIPFASRYRMIDFTLSSMSNCGIDSIGVIVNNNYQSLIDHLGSGRAWVMVRKNGVLSIFPPYAD